MITYQFSNKVVLVTGSSRGMGAGILEAFGKAGATCIVNYFADPAGQNQKDAEETAGRIRQHKVPVHIFEADVRRYASVEQLMRQAKAVGGLDVLVNNAGILRDKTLLKTDLAMWDAVIAVHLTGTFLCTQAAARVMVEQGEGGSIVNTTSVSGMLGNFGQSNYSAAKAGIYGFTRTASIELQRRNIRVNAVAPIARTRMTEDLPMFEKVETMTPEHVAPVHVFLLSSLAAEISGAVVSIAGAKLSVYKVVESPGRYKEGDGGVWTPEEIAEHWTAVSRLRD